MNSTAPLPHRPCEEAFGVGPLKIRADMTSRATNTRVLMIGNGPVFHSNRSARFCRVLPGVPVLLPGRPAVQPISGAAFRPVWSTTPIPLKLDDAIQRGLRTNLGLLERQTAIQTTRAERIRALSALLPQVTGSYAQSAQQVNLQTLGLGGSSFGGIRIPTIVGPFGYAESQANVSAPIVDWHARKSLSAARANEEASISSTQDGRDLVVQAVANAYLVIIADISRVESIQAQVATAVALYNRAVDQKKAGLVPAIDVLRADVELKTQQQRLLAQQNQLAKDKLTLGRVIGLHPAQPFDIADRVPFTPLTELTLDRALLIARSQRSDYRSAGKLLDAANETLKAARAEWYPTIDLSGYYGDAGSRISKSHGVFLATGRSISIFSMAGDSRRY